MNIELSLPPKEIKLLENFTSYLNIAYGTTLKSVILYGSAAGGEYIAGTSDINLLVVLENTAIDTLKPVTEFFKDPLARTLNPVFFSLNDLATSLDVFPVEFLDMGERYIVLEGEDLLKDLDIDRRNLRFQVEQELKSRLLKLKTAYSRCTTPDAVISLLETACSSCIPLLRNALRLKEAAVPRTKEEIIQLTASFFPFSPKPFIDVLKHRRDKTRINPAEAPSVLAALIREMDKIAQHVDAL